MSAAERLFLDHGVERTTIDEVSAAAGVAKGTFYLHFSSKADVLEALRERFVLTMLDRIARAVAERGEGDWAGRLRAWAGACACGYLDAARLHHLVFNVSPPPTREGLRRNSLIDHLARVLTGGAEAGAWSLDDPPFTAVFLFNALHGVVAETFGEGQDRSALLAAVEDHFSRIVAPSSSAAST